MIEKRARCPYDLELGKRHYFHRHVVLNNKPIITFIETTNYCNLSCPMCPRKMMARKVGFMEFDLFKRVIKKIKGNTASVWLHLYGEPLLHPELGRFINFCSANKIKPAISTNATVLDADKSRMLLDSSLNRIILCIDGINKETYSKVRAGGDFDTTKRNILNFLQLAKKRNRKDLNVAVQIIKTKDTLQEIDAFEREWHAAGANVIIEDFCSWGNQINIILKTCAPEKLWWSYRNGSNRYPCIKLWTEGGVLWNGDFAVCCMDFNGKIIAGNLSKESLKDIWNSPAMVNLRKEHIENKYTNSLCKNCAEYENEIRHTLSFARINSSVSSVIWQRVNYYIKHPSEIPAMLRGKLKIFL